jgi:hypothetical protein
VVRGIEFHAVTDPPSKPHRAGRGGGRPEEIEAETARLARFQEEVRYLQGVQRTLQPCRLGQGVLTTPRLKETIG